WHTLSPTIASATPPIRNAGALFARNIKTSGYGTAIHEQWRANKKAPFQERSISGPDITEHVSQDRVVTLFDSPRRSLNLPIEETPVVPWGDIMKDWINVQNFADMVKGNDWAPAIQAAIDSGAGTVYFPRMGQHGYRIKSTLHLRGKVERLFGMKTSIRLAKGMEGIPAMVFDEPDARRTVSIERMVIAPFKHASPGTLVVKHGHISPYTNAPGCGKLFLEDCVVADWNFAHPQKVWVRQWNVESHSAGPCIVSNGATIWSLGFKTEYESEKLHARNGAATEIFGSFIYPIGKIPADRPIFRNENSRAFVRLFVASSPNQIPRRSIQEPSPNDPILPTPAGQARARRWCGRGRVPRRWRCARGVG
ncbi:MAG: hypothetical protein O2857_30025, partial [Planctomycetota bacterium]|nr:hypothetical protein [Planctomycetota bacterium]